MFQRTLLAAGIAAFVSAGAWAGVSPDEAKQLGTTLTAVGAEKAGNKDGTIPAYTGGLTAPPASYQKGSKVRTDPFADEKPRLVITGKDAAANADKLTEGTKELLKHLGRSGDGETLSPDPPEERSARLAQRVRTPDGVHEGVRVHEDHVVLAPTRRDSDITLKCSSQSGSA